MNTNNHSSNRCDLNLNLGKLSVQRMAPDKVYDTKGKEICQMKHI